MKQAKNRNPWIVVHDPEQMYIGPFHTLDLRITERAGYWPEGIIFQHRRTQKRLMILHGRLTPCDLKETSHDTQH